MERGANCICIGFWKLQNWGNGQSWAEEEAGAAAAGGGGGGVERRRRSEMTQSSAGKRSRRAKAQHAGSASGQCSDAGCTLPQKPGGKLCSFHCCDVPGCRRLSLHRRGHSRCDQHAQGATACSEPGCAERALVIAEHCRAHLRPGDAGYLKRVHPIALPAAPARSAGGPPASKPRTPSRLGFAGTPARVEQRPQRVGGFDLGPEQVPEVLDMYGPIDVRPAGYPEWPIGNGKRPPWALEESDMEAGGEAADREGVSMAEAVPSCKKIRKQSAQLPSEAKQPAEEGGKRPTEEARQLTEEQRKLQHERRQKQLRDLLQAHSEGQQQQQQQQKQQKQQEQKPSPKPDGAEDGPPLPSRAVASTAKSATSSLPPTASSTAGAPSSVATPASGVNGGNTATGVNGGNTAQDIVAAVLGTASTARATPTASSPSLQQQKQQQQQQQAAKPKEDVLDSIFSSKT